MKVRRRFEIAKPLGLRITSKTDRRGRVEHYLLPDYCSWRVSDPLIMGVSFREGPHGRPQKWGTVLAERPSRLGVEINTSASR
jgi:hypothetical protein